MSAPPSNTSGPSTQGGQPPRMVSRYYKSEGGFVDYRGPAPEAPVPTFLGLTTRNEELGLIHLQESIPWQWGPVTPLGEVVPEALMDLTDLVDSWAITIMHSNPFMIQRPQHAYYVNKVFYEMPDRRWLVFDLLTGQRLDMWRIEFLEDYQHQDPTGIGSIDWRQSFPGLIPGAAAAGIPSGDQSQNLQSGANADQEGMSDPMPPGSVSHGPLAAITSNRPLMADTGTPQDQRLADQMPMPLPPNSDGRQGEGLVQELEDEPTIQYPDVFGSSSVASQQVSQHPVEQVFRLPEYTNTANPGNADQPSPLPAVGSSEQWTPAPPSAYTAPHDNFFTSPSFEGEGIIDLTTLVARTSRSSSARVPAQTARAHSSFQSSRRSAPSCIPGFIPRSPTFGRRVASSRSESHLPSHTSGRNAVSYPSGAIPRSQPPARSMAQHSSGGPLQFQPRSRPVVLSPVEESPLSAASDNQLLMPSSPIQGTRRQTGPSASGARSLAMASHSQYTQPQGTQPSAPTTQYTHPYPDQRRNASASNKRKRAPGLEDNPGDREARRVRLTQQDDFEDLHLLEPFPSAYQTPSATSGTPRAVLEARAKARRREAQAEDFNALPLRQRDPTVERFVERTARSEAAGRGPTGQQPLGTPEYPTPSLGTPMFQAMPSSGSSRYQQGDRNSQRDVTGGMRGQTYPSTITRPLPPTRSGSSRSTSRGQESVTDAYELSQWIAPARAASLSLGPRFPGPERTSDPIRLRNGGITGNQPPNPPAASHTWNMEQERPLPQITNPQNLNVPLPPTLNLGPANGAAFDAAANIQLDEETQAWFDALPDLETMLPWDLTDQELLNMGPSASQPPAQTQSTAVNEIGFDEDGFMTGAAMMRWAASTVAETGGMAVERNAPNQPRTEDVEGAIAMPRLSQSDIRRQRSEMQKKTEEQRRASEVRQQTPILPGQSIGPSSKIEDSSNLNANQHTAGTYHPPEHPQVSQITTPADNIPKTPSLTEDVPENSGSFSDNDSLFNGHDEDPIDNDHGAGGDGASKAPPALQSEPPEAPLSATPANPLSTDPTPVEDSPQDGGSPADNDSLFNDDDDDLEDNNQ
ncbi:MAG: hypothetical protein Q9212_006519 [Teloschistes hypoglaucus]